MNFEFKEDLKVYVENTDFYKEGADCIENYKQSVENEMKKRKDTLIDFENSYKIFSIYGVDINEKQYKSVDCTLAEQVRNIEKYYELLEFFIEEKQKKCDHKDMKYIWRDSHYDYYKCDKCGFNEKY